MSEPAGPGDSFAEAVVAARLFVSAPIRFGGMVLRGATPARAALVAAIQQACDCRRLPTHVDDERLSGGVDVAASLAAGRPVWTRGLLVEATGGVLVVPMAERMGEALAGRLAQALDDQKTALVLLDDGIDSDEAPPETLRDRIAFMCDLTQSRAQEPVALQTFGDATKLAHLTDEDLAGLAATATALGVHSLRPSLFACEAARSHAALHARSHVSRADLEAAARLVLAPRATQLPPNEQEPDQEPPPPPDQRDDYGDNDTAPGEGALEEQMIEAAAAAIPADLLSQLAKGNAPRRGAGTGSGRKRQSGLRGKPLGARSGMPRGGARLALIDTLRAAVPWQAIRRREAGKSAGAPILVQTDDLRVRRFEEKAARVTIFAVDASGSAAAARLAEAKGAVELLLAQAYVTRSQVALVAFRGTQAELILPPTRSLTRARRALSEVPGGGGTPLATGLNAAYEVAHAIAARGATPSVIVLTDGRANIAADGSPGRKQAGEDAQAAAQAIARAGIDALVIDISARPGREGPALAASMHARYLALPRADAKALHKAISGANAGSVRNVAA